MAEVTVITAAVRAEAKKWQELSDKAAPIKAAVDGLTLSASAFFIGEDWTPTVHAEAYQGFQHFMAGILAGGVAEFDQLGAALNKIADAYDNADDVVELDLNDIYSA
jgi:hypothetical protein